ncbi:hypothetical protein E2C01_080180 [Portunus trituberculatus]|uniref:Uncharacterized protein n=1 Tax=Portunus trituberculatus TaxID=210409 RepID=A0A5B7IXQ9_PORTR|nr:hypothetical protein [Portunus trituberculatus]
MNKSPILAHPCLLPSSCGMTRQVSLEHCDGNSIGGHLLWRRGRADGRKRKEADRKRREEQEREESGK